VASSTLLALVRMNPPANFVILNSEMSFELNLELDLELDLGLET
jgi:hypothetical protein